MPSPTGILLGLPSDRRQLKANGLSNTTVNMEMKNGPTVCHTSFEVVTGLNCRCLNRLAVNIIYRASPRAYDFVLVSLEYNGGVVKILIVRVWG